MVLLEGVCTDGEAHGAKQATVEAKLREEVEGYIVHQDRMLLDLRILS